MKNAIEAIPTLTALEMTVISDLLIGWDGNGGDFAFTEDVVSVPMAQARGVLSSLVKKGIIEIHEPETTDSGTWTQLDFCEIDQFDEGRPLAEMLREDLKNKQ